MSALARARRPDWGSVSRPAPARLAAVEYGSRQQTLRSDANTGSNPRTRTRPKSFFALVTASVLFGVMIAQMLLSVALESGAYEISRLQSANKEATRTFQQVSQDLDRLASPTHLARNAEALGMLANNTPAYLRLSDGAVLGSPTSGDGFTALISSDGGSLVPNSLLADVPIVTSVSADLSAQPGEPAPGQSLGAPASTIPIGPIPLSNGLPRLSTH